MPAPALTVILSDFHAGAAESLLTVLDADNRPLPAQVSPVTLDFAAAFAPFMAALDATAPPDLVILGDALDLSLAPPQVAVQVFQTFLREAGFARLFGQVCYLAGNHDHALWTAERYGATAGAHDPAQPAFWAHSSPAFAPPGAVGTSAMLNAVLSGAGFAGQVASYYPNLGLLPTAPQGDVRRVTVLHHGHFIESAYTAMSGIVGLLSDDPSAPLTAETIEAQNGAWIDFVWSTLGDDGRVGSLAAMAEAMLYTGGEAEQLQDRLAQVLAGWITTTAGLPRFGTASDWAERLSRALMDGVIGSYSDLERYSYDQPLSADSVAGLRRYLSQVVRRQITDEVPSAGPADELTFVFGHTHKPFADRVIADGFDRPVKVYNTGGWVLDTALLSTVEGAGIVFIDAAGHSAMLRLYSLSPDETVTGATIVTAGPGEDADNPLRQQLQAALDATGPAWDVFLATVTAELRRKQDYYLAQRIAGTTTAPTAKRAARWP